MRCKEDRKVNIIMCFLVALRGKPQAVRIKSKVTATSMFTINIVIITIIITTAIITTIFWEM